jgi:protein phosphatase 1 regulatory subunit 7
MLPCPQELREIECLEPCVLLERLMLLENNISKIQGLGTLTNLRELQLYSNKIRKIENLENLVNLEVRG